MKAGYKKDIAKRIEARKEEQRMQAKFIFRHRRCVPREDFWAEENALEEMTKERDRVREEHCKVLEENRKILEENLKLIEEKEQAARSVSFGPVQDMIRNGQRLPDANNRWASAGITVSH
jgi:hypothetical protein